MSSINPKFMTATTSPSSKKRPRSRMSRVLPFLVLVVACQVPVLRAQSSTCNFNGAVFQAGESLGNTFQTRCGSATEFPCFCAPERNPPIDCPYCGIVTEENSQGIVCARVDGPFLAVTNLEGIREECSCNRDSTGNPQSTCLPPGSFGNNNPAPSPGSLEDEVCLLEWADGSVDVFRDGESYGELFETRCGAATQFPCFCNVSMSSKLYCPYCSIPTPTGGLACGRINQTFAAVDETNQALACFCRDNLKADCLPATSVVTPSPVPPPTKFPSRAPRTAAPTQEPTLLPSMAPSSFPTFDATNTTTLVPSPPTLPPFFQPRPTVAPPTSPPPTGIPTTAPVVTRRPTISGPTLDKPSILLPSRIPPLSVPEPGCTFIGGDGMETFVKAGEILEGIKGPCTPYSSYPLICNPNVPGQVEYPYCVFTMDGTWNPDFATASVERQVEPSFMVCAPNGNQVIIPTSNADVAESFLTCSCLYLNPFIGAVSSCADLLVTVPLALTSSPTTAPSPAPTRLSVFNESDDTDDDDKSSSASTASLSFGCGLALLLVSGFSML